MITAQPCKARSSSLVKQNARLSRTALLGPAPFAMHHRRHPQSPSLLRAQDSDDDGAASDDWDDFDTISPAEEEATGQEAPVEEATSTTADADAPDADIQASYQDAVSASVGPPPTYAPASHVDDPDMSVVWRMGLGGIVAVAGLAGLAFLGHRLFKSQAPKVQKAMEQRQLAKESQQRLAEFMAQLRNQTTADLSAKNLGDEGFAYIVDSLSFNERCVAADFSKNGIGAAGGAQLAQALGNNTTLTSLVMDTNALGDEGASALAQALAGGSRIKTLNLGGNNVGDAGAKALAEMLKGNTSLEALELNGNVIDYEGVAALAEALTQNDALKVLSLR